MKHLLKLALACAIVPAVLLMPSARAAQQQVTIDFDQVSDSRDFSVYVENGFTLTPNVGEVRVNNAFPPGSMAAQPSFGFGQGMDSSFTFSNQQHWAFTALSIDLLEANDFAQPFTVIMIGTRGDGTVATQAFTLDGIAGTQTFSFSSEFTNLVALKIAEDDSNVYYTDDVQIDNVRFLVPLAGSEIRTRTGLYGQAFFSGSNLVAGASSPMRIPVPTLVSIYDTRSHLVKRCISNPVGQFYAYLPPGDYVLIGASMPEWMRLRSMGLPGSVPLRRALSTDPVRVTVYPNQLTGVELNFGTVVP